MYRIFTLLIISHSLTDWPPGSVCLKPHIPCLHSSFPGVSCIPHTCAHTCHPVTSHSKFYERLSELRDYHKRFPAYDISTAEDDSELIREEPKVVFTGEEANGR